MTRSEALDAIVTMAGARPVATRKPASTAYRFPTVQVAERIKAVIDALSPPGSTGAVHGSGLLVIRTAPDHREDQAAMDVWALDTLNLLLSASEWPGASGMEDVNDIVRATGRAEIPDSPEWRSH